VFSMKISEMIAKLQEIQKREGDLFIVISGDFDYSMEDANIKVVTEQIINHINGLVLLREKHLKIEV